MQTKALTDTALKSVKPKDKAHKVFDGTIGGLHVAVSPKGKKVFRLTFKFEGKEQLLTLGTYPITSLAEAREMAREALKQVTQGKNPAAIKKAAKTRTKAGEPTFRAVAKQWLAFVQNTWSQVYMDDTVQKLDKHVLPRFGDMPIADVTKADVKTALDCLHDQKKFATLKKVRGIISQILDSVVKLKTIC